MNPYQRQFLEQASAEATRANHPFPQMAACEAALESNYGLSRLARDGKNLFGMKQHVHPAYGTMNLPTLEFQNGDWIKVQDVPWVKYPDYCACFADRLSTLERLASAYPHYKAALTAQDPFTYVNEVSKTWSSDPDRARKVSAIYAEFSKPTEAP